MMANQIIAPNKARISRSSAIAKNMRVESPGLRRTCISIDQTEIKFMGRESGQTKIRSTSIIGSDYENKY